ncbi:MAG: hypothetical protein DRO40_02715 [Thermoprotei archaeon]|nr:MAG: hypothetical protein DRO40_02715 [Thermoprotei archaeon]
MINVLEYYSRNYVCKEIAHFLKDRWVGIEGEGKKWIRWIGNKPLTIKEPDDIPKLIRRYMFLKPRSFYGSIEIFRRLDSRKDVMENYNNNVLYTTVFIDVDIVDETLLENAWKYTIKAAKLITEWLKEEGVTNSIYLLWSGAGIHIRVHERAFKEPLQHYHPLAVAHAFAEYVLLKLKPQLLKIIRECNGAIKVENLVTMKRVFTAPLSLHRRLERVAVAFSPDKIEEFSLEWTNTDQPVYEHGVWTRYKEGEADDLAWRALRAVGVSTSISRLETATKLELPRLEKIIEKPVSSEAREPGRFPVMALLQAARYYLLNKDMDKAKSFGLNRAIFYAWAKYYGPSRRPLAARRPVYGRKLVGSETIKWTETLGEKVQVSDRGYYVMGGTEQRPEDFKRQVARRFEEAGIKFEEAWKAALDYVSKFPKTVLKNPQEFYKIIYEPVRDRFIERVLKKKGKRDTHSLDKWFKGSQ